MGFKNFKIQLIFRLVLSFLFISAFFITLLVSKMIFLAMLFLICFMVTFYLLYQYINKINNNYIAFLESILNEDFNRIFQFQSLGGSFIKLNEMFEKVRLEMVKAKGDRDEQSYYLNTILEQLGTAVFTYDNQGKIERINKTGKMLFGVPEAFNLKDLSAIQPGLIERIGNLSNGQKTTCKMQMNHENKTLMIQVADLQFKQKSLRLVTIQDIRSEMEENEIDAWQKLIRVLTHEIMNSITPITSLASTISVMVENSESSFSQDIREAVETIQKRSTGLLSFVESFRNLVRIPLPVKKSFIAQDFLNRLKLLTEHKCKEYQVELILKMPETPVTIISDETLLEQAMINLVNNAAESLKDNPNGVINLSFETKDNQLAGFSVTDNGNGIMPSNLEKIFIPFFTTKKNGSGIGLSLVKQIITRLKGNISVQSEENNCTTFEITLPLS